MTLINRTGITLTYAVFNSGDSSREATLPGGGPGSFSNEQVSNLDIAPATCQVFFAYGQTTDFGTFRQPPTPTIDSGAVNKSDTLIVVKRCPPPAGTDPGRLIDNYEVINWTTLYNTFVAPAASLATTVPKLDQSAKIASATVKSIGAGLSLVPVPGAKEIAGILNIVSMIVDAGSLPTTASSALDLPTLKNAVRAVVRDELDRQDAELAATQFVAANAWLADLKDGLLGPHSYADFERDLENYLGANSDFMTTLMHM